MKRSPGGVMESGKHPVVWAGWQWLGLLVLALAFAGFVIAACFVAFARGLLPHDPTATFRTTCALLLLGFGALVLARGRRNRAAALLGLMLMALATQSAPDFFPDQAPPSLSPGVLLVILIIIVRSGSLGFFWPLFTLEISGGPAGHGQARLVLALAALFSIMPIGAVAATVVFDQSGLAAGIWTVLIVGNQVLGYWILAANYRHNDAAGRNRIKIVFCAFVLFMLAGLVGVYGILAGGQAVGALVPLLSLAGAVPLVYAVSRRNLFDFGFALNRTLVYGAVSFILLAAFGLAEWGAERLFPAQWHDGGPLFSAAIALGLFLSFHRLRDWVERHVERVFFGSWHRNEATLRRFIAAASHFDQPAALYRAFAAELRRFGHGAGAALYLREAGGGYRRCAGSLARARPAYESDERALALMRAERRPVNLAQAHSSLPGALALPMLDQDLLAGFALLGRKGDGTDYRPDEIEVLGWAAQQVGFAIQARHVRELEARLAQFGADATPLRADPRGHPRGAKVA